MGNISTFDDLENSLIKCSRINSFSCLVLNINESNDQNFFELTVILSNEINSEFLVKKKLLINTIYMKEKDTEKISLKKQEKVIEDCNIKNYDLNQIKNQINNFYITIDEVKSLFKKVKTEKRMFVEILKFRIKDKKIDEIDLKQYKLFYFIDSVYVGFIGLLRIYKKKILFSTYLFCLGKNKNSNQYEYQDSSGDIIKLDIKLEKNKKYFFINLLYEPKKKKSSFIEKQSFYEEINSSLTTNSKIFQINKENDLIIEGKIIDIKYNENIIIVKDLNHKNFKDSNSKKVDDINSKKAENLNPKNIEDFNLNKIEDLNTKNIKDSNSKNVDDLNSKNSENLNSNKIEDLNSQNAENLSFKILEDLNSIKVEDLNSKNFENSNSKKVENSNPKKDENLSSKKIDNNIMYIKLNSNLMKNITFNGILYFINFQPRKNKIYIPKKFSHIIQEEKTIIEIHFIDYQMKNKYDMIKIDSQMIAINSQILKIELKKSHEKNYFREKLIYMNKNKEIHIFIIEIYKGRTNKFESFLNLENDGFYYEFLYMAKKEENLIVNQKIILNKKRDEYMHFNAIEKFENRLKGRLCIINVPEQILDEKAEKSIIKDNYNSFKYLIMMYDNDTHSISKFKLELIYEEKSSYYMDEKFEKQLNEFYNNYKNNLEEFTSNNEIIKKKYSLLFREEESSFKSEENSINNEINIKNEKPNSSSEDEFLVNEIIKIDERKLIKINKNVLDNEKNYRKYIELAFLKYNFENSQIQFKQIKMLCFLYILKYSKYKSSIYYSKLKSLLDNYKNTIKETKTLPYIDRIRIILSFTNDRVFNFTDKIKKDYTKLIKFDPTKEKCECDYLVKAYKILFKILDNLNESSSFFIALHQLNSYIGYDYYSKNKMYSSSILTVNDVKLDFIKNNHEYFFINSYTDAKTYAYYCPFTKIIYYNPYIFIPSTEDLMELKDDSMKKKATCISLFLAFHEDCGHLKNGINNLEDTPRQFYNNNLIVKCGGVPDINDAGYIIEYYLFNGVIKAKNIMSYDNIIDIESLLNFEYYVKSDLNELKNLLDKILPKKKKKSKSDGNKLKELLDDDTDYEKMDVSELFELLAKKPENITQKEYDKFLKNHKGYKELRKFYNGRVKP